MKRAALFAAIVVLGWTAWDTGADPVRFVRGLPWIADFLRRMLPPDLRVRSIRRPYEGTRLCARRMSACDRTMFNFAQTPL